MNKLTEPQIRKYKRHKARLIMGSKQSMYVSEIIAIHIIMQTILSKSERMKFKFDLGLNQIYLIIKQKYSVVIPLLKAFPAK